MSGSPPARIGAATERGRIARSHPARNGALYPAPSMSFFRARTGTCRRNQTETARWRRRPAGRGFRKGIEGGGFDPFTAVPDWPAGPQHPVPEELAPGLCAAGQIGESGLLLLNRRLPKNAIPRPRKFQIFRLNGPNQAFLGRMMPSLQWRLLRNSTSRVWPPLEAGSFAHEGWGLAALQSRSIVAAMVGLAAQAAARPGGPGENGGACMRLRFYAADVLILFRAVQPAPPLASAPSMRMASGAGRLG